MMEKEDRKALYEAVIKTNGLNSGELVKAHTSFQILFIQASPMGTYFIKNGKLDKKNKEPFFFFFKEWCTVPERRIDCLNNPEQIGRIHFIACPFGAINSSPAPNWPLSL